MSRGSCLDLDESHFNFDSLIFISYISGNCLKIKKILIDYRKKSKIKLIKTKRAFKIIFL